RLHAVAKQQSFSFRPTLSYQEFVTDAIATLRESELLPVNLQQAFWAIAEPLAEQLNHVNLAAFKHQRLHGDCHLGNMLLRDDALMFVDFDYARSGPSIQDMWMMLAGDIRAERTLQLDVLVEGYQEFCDFDSKEVALIEPLRGFRIIHYMAWLA